MTLAGELLLQGAGALFTALVLMTVSARPGYLRFRGFVLTLPTRCRHAVTNWWRRRVAYRPRHRAAGSAVMFGPRVPVGSSSGS